MIHSYPDLSNTQKFNYLHLSLSGRAESPIESFTISKDNYTAAREQLFDAYDNERVIVLRHATLLIDMLEMIDDSSASMHDIVNYMQAPILSLRALG